MKTIIKYWEIEKRYQAKGDSNDREFCKHAGINYNSYRSRMALFIAGAVFGGCITYLTIWVFRRDDL